MKKYIYILTSMLFLGVVSSCTDNFDSTNRNPNKIYEVDMQSVFPGTVYKTLNVVANMNYRYYSIQSRYTMGPFEPKDKDDPNDDFYNFYKNVLSDLKALEDTYADTHGNESAMIATWKAYVYSVLVGTWGGIPMSEACTRTPNNEYRYDSEAEVNMEILRLLDTAVDEFDVNGTKMLRDPFFPGKSSESDIAKWRKFANTLRLDVAIRMMNMKKAPEAMDFAKEQMKKGLNPTNINYIISSVDEIAKGRWGTDTNSDVSFYYNRFLKNIDNGTDINMGIYPVMHQYFFLYLKSYEDPRLSKYAIPSINDESGDYRARVVDTLLQTSTGKKLAVEYRIPFIPQKEYKIKPDGWNVGLDPNSPNGTTELRSFYDEARIVEAKSLAYVHRDFLKQDAESVILNWADACFILSEIALRAGEWGINVQLQNTAQGYYEDGIRASMSQYGISGEAGEYMDRPGVKWNTNGIGRNEYRTFFRADINGAGNVQNHLNQVWTQRYIADFFNGFAGWTLERRTRVMSYPPLFYNGSVSNEGTYGKSFDTMPERQVYPHNESNWNTSKYNEGCANLLNLSASPRPNRGGDNLFTSLAICGKYEPDAMVAKWGRGGTLNYNFELGNKWYGKTVEQFTENVKKDYPQSVGLDGLKKYIKFEIIDELD